MHICASCAAMDASGFAVYFWGGLPSKAYEGGMFVLPVQQWARVVLLSTFWGGSHAKPMKEACLCFLCSNGREWFCCLLFGEAPTQS